MPEHINPPPILTGDNKTQIAQLRAYLFTVSEAMNRNMQNIGGNELSDRERAAVQGVIQQGGGLDDVASLRDMVVRLAEYVKKAVGAISVNPLENEVSSGRFGRYVQTTTVTVPADLDNHNKALQIATILTALKETDLKIRNRIYSGELRTGVTGVAVGPDIVSFAEDGEETFTPGNAVMEILDDGTVSIKDRTTTATSFNNITDPGRYWVSMSGMTNGPSGLTTGDCMLEIITTTGIIRQRLEDAGAVYIRRKTSGTWGSWYKYTGTAV